jgi:hypothetical protein
MFFSVFYAIPPSVTTRTSQKMSYRKMSYLVEFWLILEREIILLYGSENCTQNTIECNLTNTFGLTKFGFVMKKL